MLEESTLKTRIFLRNDLLSQWEEKNPVLGKGETAVVYNPTVTGERSIQIKIGDGVTDFKNLPYIGLSNEERAELEKVIKDVAELKKLEGDKGTSEIFNEKDGGGVKFTNNDGAASFVGAHDNIGGESGIQIYSDKDASGSESTIIDVTKNGAYYTKGEVKPGAERDVPENEIATVGVVDAKVATEAEAREAADEALQTNINAESERAQYEEARLEGIISDVEGGLVDEKRRAEAAETTLQTNINNEATTRAAADSALDDRIKNLEARGRFLSSWDATTGLPKTEPSELPYEYRSGDYYLVSVVATLEGQKNYRPEGNSYTGAASTVEETEELGISDYYTFDGEKWILIPNAQKTVTFAQLDGKARDNADLNAELNNKLDIMPGDEYTAGNAYNLPYFFKTEADANKVVVTAETVSLDGNKTHGEYSLDVLSATEEKAGLMSAADKAALDKVADTWTKGEGLHSVVQVNDASVPGSKNIAQGDYSVAEGFGSMTIVDENTGRRGDYAHAEGYMATAQGAGSHAEGVNTITNNEAEHAQGRGNISHSVDDSEFGNEKNTLSSIGIGPRHGIEGRQNAAEIMQNGDAYLLGIGGYTGKEDENGLDNVSTVQEVVNNKLNVLPLVDDPEDPGYGWEYHIPYRFDLTPDAEKIALKLYTLTLDNKFTKMTFDSAIEGASEDFAGLMTAEDKSKLDSVVDVDAKTLEILPVSAYGFDTNLRVNQQVNGSALIDKVIEATNVDKKQVVIKSGDYKYNVISIVNDENLGVKGFAIETMSIPMETLDDKPAIEKGIFLYNPALGKTCTFYEKDFTAEQIANLATEFDNALKAEVARAKAAEADLDAKKVNIVENGTNGKSEIFNEKDGGGSKFTTNSGAASYVGTHDNIGGTSGVQIYSDKDSTGNESTIIDVTSNGAYYTKGVVVPGAQRDVEENEIATKGDIKAAGLKAGVGISETELKNNQTIALDLTKLIIDGGSASDWD